MCFTISKNPKYSKVRIAKRDIPCYKNLHVHNGVYVGPFQSIPYFKRGTKKPITKTTTFSNYEISEDNWSQEMTFGLHCLSNKKRAIQRMDYDETTLFKAIIPKGTRYFYNPEVNEYVAEALSVYPTVIVDISDELNLN